MATYRLKNVYRGRHVDSPTQLSANNDFLTIHVLSDEDQEASGQLYFADHAGLETEWDAGTAVTVLDAAVDSWIDANFNTADDSLSGSGQRTGKEGFTYTP